MYLRNRSNCRPGNVTVLVAVSLVALLGVLALSLDGGMLLDRRRDLQSTADAAALAGAGELFANADRDLGLDPQGVARAAATATATANGYTSEVNGAKLTINIPPLSGPHTGKLGYIEVVADYSHPRYFSKVFGVTNIPVKARAVAVGKTNMVRNAIITLNPTEKGSFDTNGSGAFDLTGSPIQVNSTHTEGMIANGNGNAVAGEGFYTSGSPGYATPGGGSFTGAITSNSQQIPDPLKYLPVPDKSTLTVQEDHKLQISGNKTVNLKPGVYVGGISITSKGKVNLAPGIYYMQSGGFNWGGQGELSGLGVMIYNAPTSNSDKIDLSGQGVATLSPPLSGPYAGVTFFQDRTSDVPVNVTGQGNMNISGTIYAAKANVNVTGNGEANLMGSQYISDTLKISGNGEVNIDWKANLAPRNRQLRLVE